METMARAGTGTSVLIWILFSAAWILIIRRKRKERLKTGSRINAAGFGIFPAVAAWKLFEPYTGMSAAGKTLFREAQAGFFLSPEGQILPWRIELIAALAGFLAIIIWVMIRKDEMPGNGDLLLTVLCIWGAIRSVTEYIREYPVRPVYVNPLICTAVAAEIIALAVWTVRRGRKQKSAGLTALEWAAVLACGAVAVILEAGIFSLGSEPANLATITGCAILSATLVLFAGKDSREV